MGVWHEAVDCGELMCTRSPANNGDVSTWTVAKIEDSPVSTNGFGSTWTVMARHQITRQGPGRTPGPSLLGRNPAVRSEFQIS